MQRYLTRRHLLVAGLIAALGALAVDQGWLFQPEASRAEGEETRSANDSASPTAPAGATPSSRDGAQTAGADDAADSPRNPRLAAYRFTDDLRDLFQPTPAILAAVNDGRSADPSRPETRRITRAQRVRTFRGAHHLQATFTGPAGPTALIDGEVRREGDRIDEFEITEIGNMKVRCRHDDVTVVLVLPIAPGW